METKSKRSRPSARIGRKALVVLAALIVVALSAPQISGEGRATGGSRDDERPGFRLKSLSLADQAAVVVDPSVQKEVNVRQGDKVGPWTLMAVIQMNETLMAVFENLEDRRGNIVYMTEEGIALTLAKSLEPTSVAEETLYRGRSLEETIQRERDFLAEEILAQEGDPTLEEVAACLPPLRVPTFVGTRHSIDKPTYDYGGYSDEIYVDVGKVETEIQAARDRRDVWEGLVGGWLPVVRFLFPSGSERYWEEVIFAEEDPSKFWTQPVWYRVLLVENGRLTKTHYFYHHLPFPPRGEPDAREFFQDLFELHAVWEETLEPPMKIEVPDEGLQDFCLHAFAREMITRVGDHPKYGYPPLGGIDIFGGYGYSNVDTFQDVFNSSVMTFLEWGLFERAKAYIDDYFTHSVRDDGSIDTRGPEIGQYGRMLTALAMYYGYTKDQGVILKYREKILAIVRLFYLLREDSRRVASEDASYGIIRGWSEHDSALKVNPFGLMLPHFSNNAEAARGFKDLGQVWSEIGRKANAPEMESEGERMLLESSAMKEDLFNALEKSIDYNQDPPYMPAVAHDTPTWGKGRVYTELLHSGILSKDLVAIIKTYQSENGQKILGLSGGGRSVSGFRAFGPAYGLIQYDWIREFLLFFHAQRAHLYARGTWTSVEGANIDGTVRGPYCTPTQLTIPALTKWMLVFEEPDDPVVWLGRAVPRAWLESGEKIKVTGAPTRFGTIDFEILSELKQGRILGGVETPSEGFGARVVLRLRVPGGQKMKSVRLNGQAWKDFDPVGETITLPPPTKGRVTFEVLYQAGPQS